MMVSLQPTGQTSRILCRLLVEWQGLHVICSELQLIALRAIMQGVLECSMPWHNVDEPRACLSGKRGMRPQTQAIYLRVQHALL